MNSWWTDDLLCAGEIIIMSALKRKVLINFLITIILSVDAQFTNVELEQGALVGLKVFPESSVPVYSFLGIPYAKPPVDNLRFAPPVPLESWNTTLLARNFQAICPQLDEQNPYENSEASKNAFSNTGAMSEDCLYLNVWAPETGFRNGNLPVLAIITGEELAFDWLQNRPTGLDLAEGIVVVTIQYRTNIFGWLAPPDSGNFALLDQIAALKWIQKNIGKFGGDPSKTTLLGHGTTGASNAMIHLTSKLSEDLFSAVILMSGSVFSSYSLQLTNGSDFYLGATRRIVLNLACDAAEVRMVMACLRSKSVKDLLHAFENVYQVGNYSRHFLGPVLDNNVIKEDPRKVIQSGQYAHKKTPVLIGIANQEGAFLKDNWLAFAKQGPKVLKHFIDSTIIPNIFEHSSLTHGLDQLRDTLEWRYFEGVPKTVPYYMNALVNMVTETHFEIPFLETIELLSAATGDQRNETNVYVYSYQQPTPIDMRGRVNYFGGSSHSSDLPCLLGPSLLQQIARRRLTQSEDKISKTMRQLFGDFIKTRNPTPGRIFDSWKTYTKDRKFIKVLTTSVESIGIDTKFDAIERNMEMLEYHLSPPTDDEERRTSYTPAVTYINDAQDLYYHKHLERVYTFWRRFLVRIQKIAQLQENSLKSKRERNDAEESAEYEAANQKFKHAFFSMLTLVCLLLIVLLICIYLLKKNNLSFPREERGYL